MSVKKRFLYFPINALLFCVVSVVYGQEQIMAERAQVFKDTEHMHLYVWGMYNTIENNYAVADGIFKALIQSAPPLDAYQGYIWHLFIQKKYTEIVAFKDLVYNQFRSNIPLQLIIICALEVTGKNQEAHTQLEALRVQYPDDNQIAYGLIVSYIKQSMADKAFTIIYDQLKKSPAPYFECLFHFFAAQLYATKHAWNQALAHSKKVIMINPQFQQGVILNNFLQKMVVLTVTEKSKEPLLELNEQDSLFEEKLVTYESEQAYDMHVLKKQALDYLHQREFDKVLTLLSPHFKRFSYNPVLVIIYIEAAIGFKQYGDAYRILSHALAMYPENKYLLATVNLFFDTGIYAGLIVTLVKNIYRQHPKPYLFEKMIMLMIKNKEWVAVKQLLEPIIYQHKDSALYDIALHCGACLYKFQANKESLRAMIMLGIKNHCTYPPFLHDCAQYYAGYENDMVIAQRWIKKALIADPENIDYLRMQATIWYKQKRYRSSLVVLDKIIQKNNRDFFSQKQYAKTLLRLGKVADAYQAACKALHFIAPESALKKLQKKVSLWQKKYHL